MWVVLPFRPATVCELALALTTNFTLCEVRLSDGVLDGANISCAFAARIVLLCNALFGKRFFVLIV